MTTFQSFVRSLGNEPGVQLSPPVDMTEGAQNSATDQIAGVIGRFQRGPIDSAIFVTRDTVSQALGPAGSIRSNPLNECGIQLREALELGTRGAVVRRIAAPNASRSFAVVRIPGGAALSAVVTAGAVSELKITAAGKHYQTGTLVSFSGPGTGASAKIVANPAGEITGFTDLKGGTGYTTAPTATPDGSIWYSVSAVEPVNFSLYLDDRHCWNSGVVLSLHAERTPISGASTPNQVVSLRVIDPLNNNEVTTFTGSLQMGAQDDYGHSIYLPDVIERQAPLYRLTVATGTAIGPENGNAYGRSSATGKNLWATSQTLALFNEGTAAYTEETYAEAIKSLTSASGRPFGILMSGGTQSIILLTKLGEASRALNIPFVGDVSGKMTYREAIDFVQGLGFQDDTAHLISFYWAPVEAYEPFNGYREVWGTSGVQVGLRCARNAQINSHGFAPKNQPIAGHRFPLPRQQLRQLVAVSDAEKSDLAVGGINPVLFYNTGGGSYQFGDCLTVVKSRTSDRRLIAVGEMSAHIDNALADYASQLTHKRMKQAVKDMEDFADRFLSNATAAEWLVPSNRLGGSTFSVTVTPVSDSPKTKMAVYYSTSFDGTLRQAFLQQAITG